MLPVPDRGAGGGRDLPRLRHRRTGLLPGLRDGVRICRDCAGITREFCCLRCGTETGMAGRAGGAPAGSAARAR